ncbi:MAG: hypothetical protein Q9162_000871 [Coniocarpon cinnabarinum]
MGPVKRRVSNAASFPSANGYGYDAQYKKKQPRTWGVWLSPGSGSSNTILIGAVITFVLLVSGLIVFLFRQHENGPGKPFQPGGVPPRIRTISEKYDKVFLDGCQVPDTRQPRANATFVVLARNKELDGVIESIKSMERHFNRWYNYPYVFLNDAEFNSTFKETVSNYTSGPVEFGQIDPGMWGFPNWTDPDVVREGIKQQGDKAIMYGGMESYHHMCRFYSGFFYQHELLQKYEWYWRIEPEIKYFCDITYDPFVEMIKNKKTYGFTIAVKELKETVPNIFRYAAAYRRKHRVKSRGLWEMFTIRPQEDEDFWPENDPRYKKTVPKKTPDPPGTLPEIDNESMEGDVYNMCHFWSNFEIARLDWFRSQEYQDFFNVMDRSGGFWMERWGDAPIHSLAAGALLSPSDIHYFRDIGYRHTTIQHCPGNAPEKQIDMEPWYNPAIHDEDEREEEAEYWASPDKVRQNGVGCRCRCDTDVPDVEYKEGSCMVEWVEIAGGWTSPP